MKDQQHISSPDVSIIVPCYNATKYVTETVQSVIDQDYASWELLLVDDCSTDGTLSLLHQWAAQDGRIRVFSLDRNSGGPAAPRNMGLSAARGEFVAFLDSDDIWPRNKLSFQIGLMRDSQCDFSSGGKRVFSDRPTLQLVDPSNRTHYKLDLGSLLRKNRINTSSVVLRRSVVAGLVFDTDPALVAVEDYKLWIALHERTPLRSIIVTQDLYNYRIAATGISRDKLMMARKVFRVLRSVRIEGRGLGVRAYLYMLTYAARSVSELCRTRLTAVDGHQSTNNKAP